MAPGAAAGGRTAGEQSVIIAAMAKERKNPFRPGMGEVPPYLAGHEIAVRVLTQRLDRLFDERPGSGVILYGPRGTGKTALLGEFRERAKKQKVRAIKLSTGEMLGSPATLADMMAPSTWFAMPVLKGLMAGAGGVSGGVELGAAKARSVGIVMRKLLRRPLLLTVDEAHTMLPAFAKILLQVSQDCINERLPLLLVLAGTPAIGASLSRADASFVERARWLKVGRLETRDAVRKALSVPAEESGMSFDEATLEFLVVESQGYPFFIQLLGEHSWNAAVARDPGAECITLEDAQLGVSTARQERDALYGRRLQEIMDRDLESEALAVSKAFVAPDAGDALSRTTLGAVLKPALTGDRTVKAAINELFAVGLIWQTDNPSLWEPGIPSLCTHITEHLVID